ncbi:hypothetical protein, partial [Phascolarctobacterium sp.]
ERKAQEAAAADPETLNKVLERLAALEQDNQRLSKNYEAIKNDYDDLKAKYAQQQEAVDETQETAEAASV